jgi:hypothetical protein
VPAAETAKKFIPTYVDAVIKAMLALENDELRNIEPKEFNEITDSIARILRRLNTSEAQVAEVIEKYQSSPQHSTVAATDKRCLLCRCSFVLDFAVICFQSKYILKRIYAVDLIKTMADLVTCRFGCVCAASQHLVSGE